MLQTTPKYYGTLQIEDNKWILNKIEPHVSIRLKHMFPKIPEYKVPPYSFDNTPEICNDLIWFMTRYPMEIPTADQKAIKKQKNIYDSRLLKLENILRADYIPGDFPGLKEGQAIRPYQAQTIEIIKNNKIHICGDDVGLGKSYTGIGTILNKEQLPAAIIVQTHLTKQWKDKIEEFSNLRVHIIKGTKMYDLPPADAYIFKYSLLSSWTTLFAKNFFKTTIFDEIQELRTGTASAKGQGAKILCQHTEYKLGLSATPIYNFIEDIYNIYNTLEENILGARHEFIREWGASTTGGRSNRMIVKNPQALGTYLRERFLFLRRRKQDVGQYLNPVNKIIETVGYDEKEVANFEEIAKNLAMKAIYGEATKERGQAAMEFDMFARQITGISKAKYVAEFTKLLLENNEPVILVGWHHSCYDIFQKELAEFNPLMYTGKETLTEKEKNKEKFINGESNLLILSLRSGVGLDGLQHRCSTVIFGEIDWSPQVHTQVIGRLDREGQKNPVMAIFLVSDFGSDPPMIDTLGLKASQSAGVIDPTETSFQVYSDKNRLIALAKQFIKKEDLEAFKKSQENSLFKTQTKEI